METEMKGWWDEDEAKVPRERMRKRTRRWRKTRMGMRRLRTRRQRRTATRRTRKRTRKITRTKR